MVVPFRGEPYNIKHLKVMGDIGQVVPQTWDLRNPDTIYEAVKHSNLVVNLVSQKSDSRHFKMDAVNVDGARLIAKVSREAGVERFVHVSTANHNVDSSSSWIRTKSQGENEVRDIFPSASIVRPTVMFGLEDSLLTRQAELVRFSPVFPIYKPDRQIQPVWNDDVARAILEIAANDKTAGKVYELAGPDVWTQRELSEFIFELLYHKPIVVDNQTILDFALKHYAQFALTVHRNPRWTPEILEQMRYDNVLQSTGLPADGSALRPFGFEDLGIPTDELTSIRRFAINVVRMYRRVHRYDANVQDSWIHPAHYKAHTANVSPQPLKRANSE